MTITHQISDDDRFESFPSYNEDKSQLTRKEKLRHFLEALPFRVFSLLLILIDCVLVLIDICAETSDSEQHVFNAIAMLFVTYFVIELGARVYSQGFVDIAIYVDSILTTTCIWSAEFNCSLQNGTTLSTW